MGPPSQPTVLCSKEDSTFGHVRPHQHRWLKQYHNRIVQRAERAFAKGRAVVEIQGKLHLLRTSGVCEALDPTPISDETRTRIALRDGLATRARLRDLGCCASVEASRSTKRERGSRSRSRASDDART